MSQLWCIESLRTNLHADERQEGLPHRGESVTKENDDESAFVVAFFEIMGFFECPKFLASEIWYANEKLIADG